MAGRQSVNFNKPAEPNFLKKFKKEIGYKEGPSVDTKRQELGGVDDTDDRPEEGDEQPVIVVPENSKISEQEIEDFMKEKERGDAKIVFKKPTKRPSDESEVNTSSTKKKKEKKDKEKSKMKKIKNNSLLSFGDEEEEES
ncbi:uncharacterized protein KIAA1143 homolog [Anneissia japonica]|uniref:uncharacterized protein KIAA1143 homolog n=1 Tax=Anneissia japonica TaxID=1529436 RepID=UPI001425A1F3|nr:uncharacterized protein KIAA1143 homolog [Anneissia japonica]